MFDSKCSSLIILIGDDVLDSIAAKIALSSLNPLIFLSKFSNASFNEIVTGSGNNLFKFANVYSPLKIGLTFPNC